MNDRSFPIKKIGLSLLLIGLFILLAFLVFVSIISINIGVSHSLEHGFWVPIVAGTLSIAGSLILFYVIARFVSKKMKAKDIINNI